MGDIGDTDTRARAHDADSTARTKRPSQPLPIPAPALTALAIAQTARAHRFTLTARLFNRASYQPLTDVATHNAISALPHLIANARDHYGDADPYVGQIAADLLAWPRQARAILDELRADEQPWTKAPGALFCPHCNETLYLPPGWAEQRDRRGNITSDVWCRRCSDDDGQNLRWAPSQWTGRVLATPSAWIPPTEAAALLGITPGSARVRAHRHAWRRTGTGRHVRYRRADVLAHHALTHVDTGQNLRTAHSM